MPTLKEIVKNLHQRFDDDDSISFDGTVVTEGMVRDIAEAIDVTLSDDDIRNILDDMH